MLPSAYRFTPAPLPLGFTLLEILVVMVIIGALATMALLSVGTQEPATAREARLLAELLRLAADEAVLQGQEWGLRLTNEGYEFMVLEKSLWQTATDEILRPRQFPPELEPRLSLEGEDLTVMSTVENDQAHNERRWENKNDKKIIPPQVLILSSGEVSAFQLTLYAPGQPPWYVISGNEGNFMAYPREQRR